MLFATEIALVNVVLFVVGLGVLVKGSDWFIEGAASVAHHYHISDVVIGLTLVSIGTSLPELAANVYASIIGKGGIAMGNVTGSNVANTLLILGLSITIMGRIATDRLLFQRDILVMVGVYVVFAAMCYLFPAGASVLVRAEGALLLLVFAVYMVHLFRVRGPRQGASPDEAAAEVGHVASVGRACGYLFVGGLMVVLGARVLVDNVVWAAAKFGIPQEVLSATVVAFGTSVPELSVTIAGLAKKRGQIAMGNIIGSNIFNLVFVMGAAAVVKPAPVSGEVRGFILPTMLASGAALAIFMRTSWALQRWEGIVFLAGYVVFIGWNVAKCVGM